MLKSILLLSLSASALTAQSGQVTAGRLDSLAGAGVAANRTVGLVAAVVQGNQTLLMKGYGKADLEWDVPMPADAMFEVGSVAKQFAAVSILTLRDAGALTLDDPITTWVPTLGEGSSDITLRHLLTHTSGIRRFTEEPDFELNYVAPRFPRDSALSRVTLDPVLFAPGEAQAYSNSGYWLLGLVIERASGLPYEEYLATQLFELLGMTRSMYCTTHAHVARRAHGYALQGPGLLRRSPSIDYTWVFAPGAVCSTAADLVTWLQALHGGKVLSATSYAELIRQATLNDGTRLHYGLGIKVGEDYRGLRYIGHGGTAPGFRAEAAWYPDAQLAVVVLMNTSPTNLSPASVAGLLAREVIPPSRQEEHTYTGDPAPFVGRYVAVVGGNQSTLAIEVTANPEGLAFAPAGRRPEPLPWAGGLTFFAGETTTLTFRRTNGVGGPVTELRRDDAGNHNILRKQ